MGRTTLPTGQVRDASIGRDDLNVGTQGRAVVTRLVPGAGIAFDWTGADEGTGDVTVRATGSGAGPQGPQGYQGSQGSSGAQGASGAQGSSGTPGAQGAQGAQGIQGAGLPGPGYQAASASSLTIGTGSKTFGVGTGYAYTAGARVRAAYDATRWMEGSVTAYSGGNLTVNVDLTGGAGQFGAWNLTLAGEPGVQGVQGPQGLQGSQGAQGALGSTGTQGPQGAQGAQGANGYVGSDGSQGAQGPQGYQGVAGTSATVNLGTVQTVPYAQGAQVTAGGTPSARTFSFAIPQGPQGYQGTQGVQGTQGYQGFQGSSVTGSQGPQGYQGAPGLGGTQGSQGPQGASGNPWGGGTFTGTVIVPAAASPSLVFGATDLNHAGLRSNGLGVDVVSGNNVAWATLQCGALNAMGAARFYSTVNLDQTNSRLVLPVGTDLWAT